MASEEVSYGTITLKGTPVSELRVTDIKRELEKRGLSKSGSKTQLTDRLKAQLLLEKLQQDAAQSSGDELEGKVPNIALQDDKAGQSELVRQYLEQQQRNLEIQMEVKKQVEEERKRKSADESSADESGAPDGGRQAAGNPDVTSPKKFKEDNSHPPEKDLSKMPRPARKSNRNTSKGENGQDVEAVKERSRSSTPENDRLRERTRSGSSSSSRSPTPEKSQNRRGRPARGRAKRGAGRRGGRQAGKESRSSSPSSSPEEVMPKKKHRRSTNSVSSRSRSRSPQLVSPDLPTRRSSRRANQPLKSTPDHGEEPPDDGGGDKNRKGSEEHSGDHVVSEKDKGQKSALEKTQADKDKSLTKEPLIGGEMTSSKGEFPKPTNEPVLLADAKPSNAEQESSFQPSQTDSNTGTLGEKVSVETNTAVVESNEMETLEVPSSEKHLEPDTTTEDNSKSKTGYKSPGGRLSRWKSSRSKTSGPEKSDVGGQLRKSPASHQDQDVVPASLDSQEKKKDFTAKLEDSELKETGLPESDGVPPATDSVETQEAMKTSEMAVKDQSKSGHHSSTAEKQVSKTQAETQKMSSHSRSDLSVKKHGSSSSDSSSSRSQSPSKHKRSRSRSSSSSSSGSGSSSRSSSSERSPNPSSVTKSSVVQHEKSQSKDRPTRARSASPSSSQQRHQAGKIDEQDSSNPANERLQSEGGDNLISQPVPLSDSKSRAEPQKPKEIGQKGEEPEGKLQISKSEQKGSAIGHDTASEDKDMVVEQSTGNEGDDTHREDELQARKDKGMKKRKWGSKTSKATKTPKRTTSMEISSDSLKNLIGDVKLTETVFDMETQVVNTLDYDEQEDDRRDIKVKRTVVQSAPSDETKEEAMEQEDARKVEAREENSPDDKEPLEPEKKVIKLSTAEPKVGKSKAREGKKLKEKKKKESTAEKEKVAAKTRADKESQEKMLATIRPIKSLLPIVDEPELVSGNQSPAYNPPDRVLRIAGLVRPFTIGQLKELLRRTGELDEEYFWINDIKSHCLAAYKTEADAVKTRAALHGTRWPQSNPKILIVDFATVEDVEYRKAAGDIPLPELRRKPIVEQSRQKERKEEEEREKRLKAREQRDKEREEREKEAREKREARDRERRREAERKNPVREWDRDKVQQLSRSHSRSKERERPPRRTRSRERDQRKRHDQSKEKKDEDKRKERKQKEAKVEEEPPAKLLDDLFRKTKATPCIYWLPLTEEQAQQRVIRKQEQEKERQKRLAAAEEREREEVKKREAARLERQRERERERERSRDRSRQERSRSSRSGSRSRSRRRR